MITRPRGMSSQDLIENLDTSALLKAAMMCVDEWSEALGRLRNGMLPEICRFRNWGSDFNHNQSWTVSPIMLGRARQERLYKRSPVIAAFQPLLTREVYCKTYIEFKRWLDLDEINYIAFSRLGPKGVLRAHRHMNHGCLKLHVLVEPLQKSGLMYHTVNSTGHQEKKIVHWQKKGDYRFFDDNYIHSAWNMSARNRDLVVIDFKKTALSL